MKVIVLMAMTVDGMIARDSEHFPNWTSKEDKMMFKEVTRAAGVLIMGSKTYDAIGKPLPGRMNVVLTRNKQRISQLKNLVFTDRKPGELLVDLEKEGLTEVILAGGSTINTLFAKENLIDELQVTYTPKIFGQGLSLFADRLSMDLELIDFKQLGADELIARYRVVQQAPETKNA
jgi:dihydrofolate reductase